MYTAPRAIPRCPGKLCTLRCKEIVGFSSLRTRLPSAGRGIHFLFKNRMTCTLGARGIYHIIRLSRCWPTNLQSARCRHRCHRSRIISIISSRQQRSNITYYTSFYYSSSSSSSVTPVNYRYTLDRATLLIFFSSLCEV